MSSFNYIRNQIRLYKKTELIDKCYYHLSIKGNQIAAIWDFFIILKWTYQYGGEKHPSKTLSDARFNKIYKEVNKLNDPHLVGFMKSGDYSKVFQILHMQQIYLQKSVMTEHLAVQLKLYNTIKNKLNVNEIFLKETGLTITDFIFFLQTVWLIINASKGETSIKYYGYLSQDHIEALEIFKGKEKTKLFIDLLSIDPLNAIEKINKTQINVKTTEWHSLAKTFFTIYPFQQYKNQIKIIHDSVFNYTVTHFIYDFLKPHDGFAIDFGRRIEKYVGFGLAEMEMKYLSENKLKEILPKDSNVADYYLVEHNIIIECKAVELSVFPSVNPTDEFLFNYLRNSIIKAYAKQMLTITNKLEIKKECFGLIITYKEFHTSRFSDIFELSKKEISSDFNTEFLPPENVFIIDIFTWDRIVQIVKNKEATINEILLKVKSENSVRETAKQFVSMSLDDYNTPNLQLSYLSEELKSLDVYKNFDEKYDNQTHPL